ncbi:ribonuclease J [Candidatus Uhrbacteria bacterium]|nr:ribonuclease J [Candidatus Uhrbacteria bacterium]
MEAEFLAKPVHHSSSSRTKSRPRRQNFSRRRRPGRERQVVGTPAAFPLESAGVSTARQAPAGGPAAPSRGKPLLRVYALGGLEEVGRNCMVFEYADDIVIVDMGLQFPEEDMHGIDYIIPNIACLRGKEKNIRGVVITHGHYDHIGGIPHLMGRLGNPPIFTTALSAGIIRKRQEEFTKAPRPNIVLIKPKMKIALGRHFVCEPFHVNHNITDATGIALQTPYGLMLHTGDFKFDETPVNEDPPDFEHIKSFGDKGVLALFSDSTDAPFPGHQISEQQVFNELEKIFQQAKGRLIFGTFASLLTRIQHLLTLSEKYGRKVLIQGRSMVTNVEIAHELGALKFHKGLFVEDREFNRLPDGKVTVICTGAQGEKNAQLMRIANSEHRLITLKKGDSIIFSSSVIPGNERTVQSLKDALIRHGAKIYHYQFMDIHAGGHAKQDELKQMIKLTRPRYLVPEHANRFMLQAHADLAIEQCGMKEENIFVADNGQIMEFDEHGGRLTENRVPTDYVMVDGLGVGDVSAVVLRDRQQLADDGMFVVIATIDRRTGALIGSPDIISRGFVYLKESRELIERSRALVRKILRDTDPKSPAFEDHLKNKIRNDVGQFLYNMTRRRPMVLPVLIEV